MNDLDLMINCQWDCNYPMLFSTKLKSMRNLCPLSIKAIIKKKMMLLGGMNYDAQGDIQNYIEQKIRGLLEDPMNEYQDPNWVQAALLIELY